MQGIQFFDGFGRAELPLPLHDEVLQMAAGGAWVTASRGRSVAHVTQHFVEEVVEVADSICVNVDAASLHNDRWLARGLDVITRDAAQPPRFRSTAAAA